MKDLDRQKTRPSMRDIKSSEDSVKRVVVKKVKFKKMETESR